jgi:hypothetical protein
MVDRYYLHDAVVRGMGQEDRKFLIMLQLDTPPQSLLTFSYDLAEDPVIDRSALPAELCAPGSLVDWQHDEIERIPGEPATWAQSILFSNGWEVRLLFRDVQVQEVQPLIPAPRNGCAVGASPSVPHSA